MKVEVADVLIDRNVRFVSSQGNVRNGASSKKYIANIEHEKIGTPIQNHAVTFDQNVNDDFEIDFDRYQLETDRKFEKSRRRFA